MNNTEAVIAPTLRQRLLSHVLLPVFVVWLTSTALIIEIAYLYTQRAFDRALIDDAYALSAHVRQSGEGLTLELSARELDSVLFDQSEKVYFAVVGACLPAESVSTLPAGARSALSALNAAIEASARR